MENTYNNGGINAPDVGALNKCNDNKMVKSPLTWVIYPLTLPQVANQQQQKDKK